MSEQAIVTRARARSIELLEELDFPIPPQHFPILDVDAIRDEEAVIDRALAVNVVIGLFFGMPSEVGLKWLEANGLSNALTPEERRMLSGEVTVPRGTPLVIEGLWILVYALSLIDEIRHDQPCGDNLASLLPDLRTNENPDRFRAATKLRSREELVSACDLLFCLTWGLREAQLQGAPAPGKQPAEVIWARRAAADWILGYDWDNPELST